MVTSGDSVIVKENAESSLCSGSVQFPESQLSSVSVARASETVSKRVSLDLSDLLHRASLAECPRVGYNFVANRLPASNLNCGIN